MINKFSYKTRVMQGLLAQSVVHLIGSSLTGIAWERVQTLSDHILLSGQLNLKANSLVRSIPYHVCCCIKSCSLCWCIMSCVYDVIYPGVLGHHTMHLVMVIHSKYPVLVYHVMYPLPSNGVSNMSCTQ